MRVALTLAATAALLIGCKGNKDSAQDGRGRAELIEQSAATSAAPPPVDGMAIGKVGGIADMAASKAAPSRAPQPDSKAIGSAVSGEVAPSMMIRTGNAALEVEKLDPAMQKIGDLATQLGGYIANSSVTGGRDQIRSATLEVKIPAARYDQAIGGLGGIGKVESVNTSVEDVGEEYVDLAARMTNAKRLEERLMTLLTTRTGRLEDVLAVERELARVREEIERFEGRMRFLRTRAAVSTLTVNLHEPFPLLGQRPGENPIAAAIKQAWRNFVGFIAWTIASLGVLVPVAVILAGVWYFARRKRAYSSGPGEPPKN